jgi:hypothetical protein
MEDIIRNINNEKKVVEFTFKKRRTGKFAE